MFMRLKQANGILIIFVLQCALLAFFVAQIPLHRMYGFADSEEYQRIALFILGKSGLAGGYAQFFPPGLSAAVAVLYLATNNIDVASMIANFTLAYSITRPCTYRAWASGSERLIVLSLKR
jgi:hypothetical protein